MRTLYKHFVNVRNVVRFDLPAMFSLNETTPCPVKITTMGAAILDDQLPALKFAITVTTPQCRQAGTHRVIPFVVHATH